MIYHQVLSHRGLEERAEAMEEAWLGTDELYAQALIAGLGLCAPTLPTPYREAAQALRADLQARGALALSEHQPPWPADEPHFPADPSALDLRLVGFLQFYLASAADPLQEGVLPALIQFAELHADFSALEREEAALDAAVDEVLASPRLRAQIPRVYVVPAHADLGDIAADLWGARERWPELIRRYRLEPPYFSDTPQDGKLTPGTRLPLPPGDQPAGREGLGYTFALSTSPGPRGLGQAWDLVDQPGSGLASDSGLAALGSDLALRTATPLGSLEYEEDYGVYPIAGTPGSVSGMLRGALYTEALLGDPRVERVVTHAEAKLARASGVLVEDIVVIPRPELLEG